jgi:hypothetical protein
MGKKSKRSKKSDESDPEDDLTQEKIQSKPDEEEKNKFTAEKNQEPEVADLEDLVGHGEGNSEEEKEGQILHTDRWDDVEVDDKSKSKIIQKRVKNHGMTWPLHPFQVSAWIVFSSDFLIFFFIIVPALFHTSHWSFAMLMGLLYFVVSLGVVLFGLKATLTDPTDWNVVFERKMRAEGKVVLDNEELEYYCDVCEAYVGDWSKHCGDCNRCVELFDHHCKWMNNCVGAKNYHQFLILITIVMIQSMIYMVLALLAIILTAAQDHTLPTLLNPFYSSFLWYPFVLIMLATMFVNTMIIIFTVLLIKLHIKLNKTDFTAYEYLMYKSDKKDWKTQLKDKEISKEEYEEKVKEVLNRENRKKRSKIVHEIKKEEKQRRWKEKLLKHEGKIVTSEDMKKESYYYWCSSSMCTPSIKKRKKTTKDWSKKYEDVKSGGDEDIVDSGESPHAGKIEGNGVDFNEIKLQNVN